MHPVVFAHYEQLFRRFPPGERVLEIGATPATAPDWLRILPGRDYVGLNIEGESSGDGWRILEGNGHALPFEDDDFDAVVCNATLEHDDAFWRTAAEVRRVAKPGGLFFVGAPGYSGRRSARASLAIRIGDRLPAVGNTRTWGRLISTSTYPFHAAPADYWRFSPSAIRDVILDGFGFVPLAVEEVYAPPRMIGVGRRR